MTISEKWKINVSRFWEYFGKKAGKGIFFWDMVFSLKGLD